MVVGEFTTETELVVIGGGPGGYSTAFRAAELGVATTIVDDRPRLGGTWLHEGCLLSKDLVQLASTVRAAAHAAAYGVEFGAPRFDLAKVRAALDTTVDRVATDLDSRCVESGIQRLEGRARFENSRQLSIAGSATVPRLRFKRAVIATGSRERGLPDVTIGAPAVLSSRDALALPEIPESLLVVGGSTSAIELAGVFAALGSRVTLVDAGSRLLPDADDDLVAVLNAELDTTLESIALETTVGSVEDTGSGVTVELATAGGGTERRTFARLLAATGRQANVEGLDLARTGVELDADGFVTVDEQLRTTDPRIFAIGDVLGPPMVALKAVHQGLVVAEVAAGWASVFDVRVAPHVLFTDPQLAWCGLTEREANAEGRPVRIARTATGVATPFRRHAGFTKIVHDPDTGLVLGVGVAGVGAAEVVAEGALAIEMGAVTSDIAAIMHPHPSPSESLGRVARQADAESSTVEPA